MLGLGFVLIFVLPGAYVSLPHASMDLLPTRAKLRVIAAGIWHNLLLWLAIALTARLGLGSLLGGGYVMLGYVDRNDQGVVVQSIQEVSVGGCADWCLFEGLYDSDGLGVHLWYQSRKVPQFELALMRVQTRTLTVHPHPIPLHSFLLPSTSSHCLSTA